MTVLDNKTKLNYQNGYLIYNKKYIFKGKFLSKDQFKIAEICFNTSMTGYQEILTDPSYKSQFINFTFPLIGIVGCNDEDYESWKIHASGLICNELFELSSNWRAQTNFTNWIISQNSCAFFDLDTRAVTKIVRNFGPKNIMLCSEEYFENKGIDEVCKQIDESLSLEENDVIKDFTTELNIEKQEIGKKKYSIAFLNFGAKDNIKKNLYSRNCKIEEFDMNFKAEDIINKNFDGFFLSNGPGDPKKVYENIKPELNKLLNKKIPTFGICLGHQIIAHIYGGKTFKLLFGHRGGNQPVKEINSGRVYPTSQNHGYAVSDENFPSDLEITHININDNTVSGLKHRERPIISIQYHSEACPGPVDSEYIFDNFIELIKGKN